jgi:tRNA pseudouridine38-40 synthase
MGAVKVKLTIAYEGTEYSGWQWQTNRVTVQQRVEEALASILQETVRLHSSSRTDTGVHAVGLVAHVKLPERASALSESKLELALNAHLPDDIRVVGVRRVPAGFHARFDARGKQYRYQVWNGRSANPLMRRHAWLVYKPLDMEAVRSAARLFVGRHDFVSFAGTRNYEMESTVRTVVRCDVQRRGSLITFIIEADGFLYKMCRSIVGTLIQIGLGKFDSGEIRTMLERRDRRVAGMTAPAHGLTLWKVYYASKRLPRKPARERRSV